MNTSLTMGPQRVRWLTYERSIRTIIALAAAGLLLSLYLLYDHFDDTDHAFCDFGSHISCTKVKNSPWALLFNVPVAAFGVGWFVVLLALSVVASMAPLNAKHPNIHASAVFYWSLLGAVFVIYLVFAEFLLQTICPTCTVIHVITLVVLGLSWKFCEEQPRSPTMIEMFGGLQSWLLLIVCGNLLIILYFNMPVAPSQLDVNTAEADAEFAKCVTANNWKFVGISGCSYCEAQKALFGDNLRYIEFVDCLIVECSEYNLRGYPTWILEEDGAEIARWTGYASLVNLQAFSGCTLAEQGDAEGDSADIDGGAA